MAEAISKLYYEKQEAGKTCLLFCYPKINSVFSECFSSSMSTLFDYL